MRGVKCSRMAKCSVVTWLMNCFPIDAASVAGAVADLDHVVREYGSRLNDLIIDLNLDTALLKADGSEPGSGVGSLMLP